MFHMGSQRQKQLFMKRFDEKIESATSGFFVILVCPLGSPFSLLFYR